MKCYICKNHISTAIRHYMTPKNRKEKAQFRNFCGKCYPLQMKKEGYVLNSNNVWEKGRES